MSENGFQGWPIEAFEWFDGIEANNEKAWFVDHRETYVTAIKRPLEALLAETQHEFGPGTISRPNRDIRFSANKSPYRENIFARLMQPSGSGYYVALNSEGVTIGAGLYAPEKDRLAQLRSAIADDESGGSLETTLSDLQRRGYTLMTEGSLKTAPRGYPKDHPRIELLRMIHLAVSSSFGTEPWLHTDAALDRITDGWRAMRPLLEWIDGQ